MLDLTYAPSKAIKRSPGGEQQAPQEVLARFKDKEESHVRAPTVRGQPVISLGRVT
jgi:hypothetical protein